MRHYFLLILLTCFYLRGSAQFELVPYGDFESQGAGEVALCPSEHNTFNWPLLDSWSEMGLSDDWAPTFFSAQSQYSDCSVPTNFIGTQIPFGGLTNNSNYVGMLSGEAGLRRDGIRTKLRHKLRSGHQYTLRFNAVKKSSVDPEIEFRFGSSDTWEFASCFSCSQSSMTIGADGGANNDQWGSYSVSFFVEGCDVEWLFIRMQSSAVVTRLLIDNISIDDPCGAPYVCADGYGSLDNITVNEIHNGNQVLSFHNLENVENFHLTISDLEGHPVRTIFLPYPPSVYYFDGLDENGDPLVFGTYVYTLHVNNTCQCMQIIEENFLVDDPPILEAYIRVDPAYNAITAYNLRNVTFLRMLILEQDGDEVRRIEIVNPANEVAWDGITNFNAFAGSAYYTCQVYTESPCGDRLGSLSFQHLENTSQTPISPNADYNSHPKTIDCTELLFDEAPPPCCGFIVDWYISDKHIAGVQDYKINNDIVALQNVVIDYGSDIYFQAGNEIVFYPEFTVDAGAEFEAVILPCAGRLQNPNNSSQEEIVLQQDTVLGTKPHSIGIFTPNPSEGTFQVELKGIGTEDLQLFVTDVYGRVVYTSVVPNQSAEKSNFTLDLNALGAGLYSCSIYQNEEQILVEKLIVQ